MPWGSYEAQLPPLLTFGDTIQFRTAAELAGLYHSELEHERLMAIDTEGLPLFARRTFQLTVMGMVRRVPVDGQAVHKQGDIIGLQLDCTPAVLEAIRALLADAGLTPTPQRTETPEAKAEEVPDAEEAASVEAEEAASVEAEEAPATDAEEAPTADAKEAPTADAADANTPEQGAASEPAPTGPEHSDEAARTYEAPASTLELHGRGDPDYGGLLTPVPLTTARPTSAPPRRRRSSGPPDARRTPAPLHSARPTPAPAAVDLAAQRPVERGAVGAVTALAHCIAPSRPTLFTCLRELHAENRAGRLTIHGPGAGFWITLDAESHVADFDFDLGPTLAELPLPDHVRDGLKHLGGGIQQASWLVADGPPGSPGARPLRKVLRKALSARLARIGRDGPLRYEFDPNARVVTDPQLQYAFLGYARRWFDAVLGKYPRPVLDKHFAPMLDQYPRLRARGGHIRGLRINEREQHLLENTLQKGRRLRELLTMSPLSHSDTLRMFALLQAVGELSFDRLPSQDSMVEDVEAMLDRRRKVAREDHFAALSVHLSSHHSEYAAALARIREKYGPDGVNARTSARAADACREILERAERAYEVLRARRGRMAYRNELRSQTELIGFADLLVGKMKIAHLRGQAEVVAKMREVAMELHPPSVRDAEKALRERKKKTPEE